MGEKIQFGHLTHSMGLSLLGGVEGDLWSNNKYLSALCFNFGLAGMLFPQAHSTFIKKNRFKPNFVSCVATLPRRNVRILHLFWYQDRIKWRPHNYSIDPLNKTIVDNAAISPLDLAYLIACSPGVLIYRYGQHIGAEVYHRAH